MLAADIISNLRARGFAVWLADADAVRVTPASQLTKEDRARLRCYKPELLRRLRRPEGEPLASEYDVPVFIDGERVRIPMAQLVAEGRAIVAQENLQPKTEGLDPDMWAAAVALERYDAARREPVWVTL